MKTPLLHIAPGEIASYRGKPCLVLEHRQDGTLLLHLEPVQQTFGANNNFATSELRAHLNNAYLWSITEGNPDEIITRTVDLTALNGSKEYGACDAKVAPLTLDELRKYHDILRAPEHFEWSVTPWCTPRDNEDDTWVLGLFSDGGVDYDGCTSSRDCRPAFVIDSRYVSGDHPQYTGLEQFSTDELAEELFRRIEN